METSWSKSSLCVKVETLKSGCEKVSTDTQLGDWEDWEGRAGTKGFNHPEG